MNSTMKVSKKANIRNRYNQALRLAQDTTSVSDKNTRKQFNTHKRAKRLADHRATMDRQESMTHPKHKIT